MSGVSITVDGQKLVAALGDGAKRCIDWPPVGKVIGELLLRSILRNFEAQGRPKKWDTLKESTIIARAGGVGKVYKKSGGGMRVRAKKIILGAKILIASSRLRNSITYRVGRNMTEAGTNLIYAATQHFGRTKGRGAPISARPYVIIQPEDEKEIGLIISDNIMEVFE